MNLVNHHIAQTGSRLCVGLDPDFAKLPEGIDRNVQGVDQFLSAVIEATSDVVCAYKPNLAFFEAMGREGYDLLKKLLAKVPDSVLTIGDGKRGDIGNTSARYAEALFEDFGFGSTTVNPMMGEDCVGPFLTHGKHLSFLLCLTSNPGAQDFILPEKLYLRIAKKAEEWNQAQGNVGLVVGATRPEYVAEIREAAPSLPFLIPGVGAQGGEIETVVKSGRDNEGEGLIFNVSRGVLYAGKTVDDYIETVRQAACDYNTRINEAFD